MTTDEILFIFVGILAIALAACFYFIVKGRRIDREIREKQKFLDENPSPKGPVVFYLHDN